LPAKDSPRRRGDETEEIRWEGRGGGEGPVRGKRRQKSQALKESANWGEKTKKICARRRGKGGNERVGRGKNSLLGGGGRATKKWGTKSTKCRNKGTKPPSATQKNL